MDLQIVFWVVVVTLIFALCLRGGRKRKVTEVLPPQFLVVDIETTGLRPGAHEIIEIAAIRVNTSATRHDTFQALVIPTKKVPKRITQITGITQEMIDREGEPLDQVMRQFMAFIGELPIVCYNADFDREFLRRAAERSGVRLTNRFICALKLARRAFPGRRSYKLPDMAKDGGLSTDDLHRALADCQRTLLVYTAAVDRLGRIH